MLPKLEPISKVSELAVPPPVVKPPTVNVPIRPSARLTAPPPANVTAPVVPVPPKVPVLATDTAPEATPTTFRPPFTVNAPTTVAPLLMVLAAPFTVTPGNVGRVPELVAAIVAGPPRVNPWTVALNPFKSTVPLLTLKAPIAEPKAL